MSETIDLSHHNYDPAPQDGEAAGAESLQGVVPARFQEIASLLYEETDLSKRDQLKAEAASSLHSTLDGLDQDQVPGFLGEINQNYEGVFDGQDLLLLSSSRENIVMVNTRGELEEVQLTSENADDMLRAVKAADAETRRGHSYGLRHEILKRSEGKIPTHQAYTYAEDLPQGGDLDAHLDDPESWIPERRQLQEAIFQEELAKAHALSERLGDERPTVYALRGNTAAGKTTAVRTSEAFAKALDEDGEPTGSINPDTYKTILKQAESEGEVQTVSHFQSHEEGSMIARKINASLAESESSMVIDKRMSKDKNIVELIKLAESSGREVKILDVDVPLEISLVRVLERPVGGESPNVPFYAVAEGFSEIRTSRAGLLDTAANDEKITDYVLRVADSTGKSVEVARKVDGKMIYEPEHQDLLVQSVDAAGASAEIAKLADTKIDDKYIEGYISRVYAEDPQGERAQRSRAALVRYRGKTLKQALDKRASTLNE